VLVVMAYSYLVSAFIGMAITRIRQRGVRPAPAEAPPALTQPRDTAAR
jgi:hypothetical protein